MTATSRDNPRRINWPVASTLRHLALLAAVFTSAGLMAASDNLQAQSAHQPGPTAAPAPKKAGQPKPKSQGAAAKSPAVPVPVAAPPEPVGQAAAPSAVGSGTPSGPGDQLFVGLDPGLRMSSALLGRFRKEITEFPAAVAKSLRAMNGKVKDVGRQSGDPILEDDLSNAAEEMTAEFAERVKSAYPGNAPLLLVAFAERGPYLIAVAHLFEFDAQGKPVVRPVDRPREPGQGRHPRTADQSLAALLCCQARREVPAVRPDRLYRRGVRR